MIEAAGALFKLPAFVPGWQLRSVDCDVRAQTCDARWQRKGGRFEELAAAVPGQQLVPPAAEGAAPAFDEASTRWALAIQREPLPLELPTYDAAVTRAGNMFQRWKTADIALDMKPPTLWPVVAGVPSSLRLPQTLARGEVVVKEVPAPFVVEALRTAPAWLSWNAVHLEVADPSAGSARSQLKFTLSGNYYVSTTH